MDFDTLKAIPLPQIVARYGIALTYSGDGQWAKARCPLPSHKAGDKDKNFSICIEKNTWSCFSDSCKATSGCKYGDAINFVAVMDHLAQFAAAKKLAQMFGIKETAQHRAERSEKQTSKGTDSNHGSSDRKSNGYLHNAGVELDEILKRGDQEDEESYLKRVKKIVMTKLRESYLNGQKVARGS